VHPGRPRQRVDLHVAIRDDGDPENHRAESIAAIDGTNRGSIAGVEIMREINVVLEVRLTSINVQSDFDKCSGIERAVHALVRALHEAQVGVPEETVVGFVALVADPIALDADSTVEADEIGDLVGFVAKKRRHLRIGVGGPLVILVDVETGRVEGAGGQGQGQRNRFGSRTASIQILRWHR